MFYSAATTEKEHIRRAPPLRARYMDCQLEVRYGKAKKMILALQFTSREVEMLPEHVSFQRRYARQRLNCQYDTQYFYNFA
jgi:hypothetical protein